MRFILFSKSIHEELVSKGYLYMEMLGIRPILLPVTNEPALVFLVRPLLHNRDYPGKWIEQIDSAEIHWLLSNGSELACYIVEST